MLEFADMGAKVLHSRAVQIAMRYDFPIRVMSSFLNALGTTITKHSKNMESPKIIGIAHNKNIVLTDFKFKDYKAMEDLFVAFAENDIHVESINRDTKAFVECIIQLGDIAKVQVILDRSPDITYNIRTDIAIVSIIGFSLKNDTNIFSKVLSSLARDGIEIMSMMSSQIKLSIMVPEPATERAVKILHGLLIC
jgi:aspartate kinase